VTEPSLGPTLEERAREFAHSLTSTVAAVLGSGAPTFVAEAAPRRGDSELTRLIVHTGDDEEVALHVDGHHAFNLVIAFTCEWDNLRAYLAVRRAHFHVFSVESFDPLFRYEYVDNMQSRLPSAHLHVHAHRDEIVFQLFRSEKKKGKSQAKKVLSPKLASPRLSSIHFPLGGARMRPALEDVLELLITEFCIDTDGDPWPAIEAGRADWRRSQVGTLVRDSPQEAIRVLRSLGYAIVWAGEGNEPGERTERLTSI
jgi:hypothetical protein